MKIKRDRRKRILIEKKAQILLAFTHLGYIILYFFILAILVFIPLIYSLATETSPLKQYEVASAFLAIHARLWIALLIILLPVGIHSIFFTNRIFGPIYRMKRTLHDVTNHNLSQTITLRKHDFFKHFSEEINSTLRYFKENISYLRNKNKELSEAIAQLIEHIEKDTKKETISKIENVKRVEEELQKFFDKFHGI